MRTLMLCVTPDGCDCGAPASTPRGMHHRNCAIRTPAPTTATEADEDGAT